MFVSPPTYTCINPKHQIKSPHSPRAVALLIPSPVGIPAVKMAHGAAEVYVECQVPVDRGPLVGFANTCHRESGGQAGAGGVGLRREKGQGQVTKEVHWMSGRLPWDLYLDAPERELGRTVGSSETTREC